MNARRFLPIILKGSAAEAFHPLSHGSRSFAHSVLEVGACGALRQQVFIISGCLRCVTATGVRNKWELAVRYGDRCS